MQKNFLGIFQKKILRNILKNEYRFKYQPNFHHSECLHTGKIRTQAIFKFSYFSQGLIGKLQNRKCIAFFLHFFMFRLQRLNIIITGNIGSGKLNLAIRTGILAEKHVPFIFKNELELNFPCTSKLENLVQLSRKAVSMKFYETSMIIEGKILGINVHKINHHSNNPFCAQLTLKYNQVQSIYQIDKKIYKMIMYKRIRKGDFVTIDLKKNTIKKAYLPVSFENKNNTNTPRFRTQEHVVNLHELDFLNFHHRHLPSDFFFNELKEIPTEIREKINKIVFKWKKNKKIKLFHGIFLLNCENFPNEELSIYLAGNIGKLFFPSIILVTSELEIKNTNYTSIAFHNIPNDFLDRFLLIRTDLCCYTEIENILYFRENKKVALVTREARELLIKLAIQSGLKYAIYIIHIVVLVFNCKIVEVTYYRVKKSFLMFIDEKRLKRYTHKTRNVLKNTSRFFIKKKHFIYK